MTRDQCCQCTRAGHVRPDKQYSVRSVALRGDNDDTLEVCIAAEESDSLQEPEADSAACRACPPACSDPHCVACLQKCPHMGQEPPGYHQYQAPRRGVQGVQHQKYRSRGQQQAASSVIASLYICQIFFDSNLILVS